MPNTKRAQTDQSKRFVEKARELGCDEDPNAFERTFSKIVPPKKPQPKKTNVASNRHRAKFD